MMTNIAKTLLLFTLTLLTACGQTDREKALQDQRAQQLQAQVAATTPEFNNQMSDLLDHYFDLKDALVNSDAESSLEPARLLISETERVDPSSINAETAEMWRAYKESILSGTTDLTNQNDIEDQRYHFESISEAMINMVTTFRPLGYEVYHQSCPMVRDGSADWLSREEGIRNPYHGDRMMRCGEVIRRI